MTLKYSSRSDKSSTGQSKSTPILEQLHSGKLVDHRTADAAQSIRSVHEKLYLGRGKKVCSPCFLSMLHLSDYEDT